MARANKSTLFLIIVVLFGQMALAPRPASGGGAVAKVNDAVLTEEELTDVINRLMPTSTYHRTVNPEKIAVQRGKALEELINEELFYQEALRMGMAVDKKFVSEAKKKTVERLGGKKKFKEALKRTNIAEKEYERWLGKGFLVGKLLRAEVEDKAMPSDETVREQYEKNKSTYLRPEARRLRHILISAPADADADERERKWLRAGEALEKARRGVDFSTLAWEYSDDPYKVKGGDLGLVHKGRLDPELEEEAFKLKEGEMSGIIETNYGFHIVIADKVVPAEVLGFEDAAQGIRRRMAGEKSKELKQALIERLRAAAKIEVY